MKNFWLAVVMMAVWAGSALAQTREQLQALQERTEAERVTIVKTKKALLVALTLLEEQFGDEGDA